MENSVDFFVQFVSMFFFLIVACSRLLLPIDQSRVRRCATNISQSFFEDFWSHLSLFHSLPFLSVAEDLSLSLCLVKTRNVSSLSDLRSIKKGIISN
jgi:hypothetical protein